MAGRECSRVLLEAGRLPNVELGAVPTEAVAEVETIPDGVAKVNADICSGVLSARVPTPRHSTKRANAAESAKIGETHYSEKRVWREGETDSTDFGV